MKRGREIKILFLLVIFVLIAANLLFIKKIDEQNAELLEEQSKYPEVYDKLSSVNFTDFQNQVNEKDTFYVYIGRPTCGDCNSFEPDFLEMLKEKKMENKIVYLNVTKIHEQKNKWKDFVNEYQIEYTPTVAKYKKGKLISKVQWTPEKGTVISEFNEWLDENL